MPNPGTIVGTHHLTFCVGGAQEDYDFHVRTLGLKSVKKTVLFDGEIPIYHLYYGNRVGDASTILTAFPYRQAGWMGKRGTNQLRTLNLAVPKEAIGFWADRLQAAGIERTEVERFRTQRLEFAHPCGIPYAIVGETDPDPREPYAGSDVPVEHAIRGAFGTTTSVREPEPMDFFLREGMNAEHVSSEGPHHQYRIGTADGHGRIIELVEEPDRPQGTWSFGEGTIHHQAFDVSTPENQLRVKDYIVGLGFTDVSDVKDRGYFFSVYCRTPGGALFEFAYSTEAGFLIDEAEDELGTHMCIPPHWEDRRAEIAQLEPIETIETVV
ncbi:VOC family protein [Candidatus Solirubrobacter pratensis]|uniref:ring-cleaving dioxygenase n=1 Tax=Candidatus Solirubrobacter pratensis TaxID=1298857 RepID=UPI000427B98B|nr:ring-cleaving dioxygenase [Candidatus Solirubrobacter pratensis]